METCAVNVPEAIREEVVGCEEESVAVTCLNEGKGDSVTLLEKATPSQTISMSCLTMTTEMPCTSAAASASWEIERLEGQLAEIQGRNEEKDVQIKEQNEKLDEAAYLIYVQQMKLDKNFVQAVEKEVKYKSRDGKAPNLKEVLKLLSEERQRRLKAEEKVDKLKGSLKIVNGELMQLIKELKEDLGLMEGKEKNNGSSSKDKLDQLSKSVNDKLVKKEEEQIELKRQVKQMNQFLENLLEKINSQKLMAPPAKVIANPKTLVDQKNLSKPLIKVGKLEKSKLPPKKRVYKNGEDAQPANIPCKFARAQAPLEIPVITLDHDEDDVSGAPASLPVLPLPQPQPFPTVTPAEAQLIKKEGSLGVPSPSSSKQVTKEKLSHQYFTKIPERNLFYCICGKKCHSIKGLQAHVYSNNIVSVFNKNRKSFKQIAGSIVKKPQKFINKKIRHYQISSSSMNKYTCACGNSYARELGFLKHIANF